ncbi:hypothetical protein D9Q98_004380 [Chlorella vulgaris]|uniref:Uncharacterized protein n=1 Tax=Chlorella vulgaris TaxID=3077 RepID=A0A9D4TPI9_CHLVU|nr:hypothetical protein D9Q98_004380 [Chlorella vulgaris]
MALHGTWAGSALTITIHTVLAASHMYRLVVLWLAGSAARASEMLACWLVAGGLMLIGAGLGVEAWVRGAGWVASSQIVTVWTVTAIVYVMLLTWPSWDR